MELKTIEKKLLYELDKNSRRSYNQIAKAIKGNKNTCRYITEKLIKLGVITKFFTIIDNYRLGYTQHKVFIRLQNLIDDKKEEMINYLNKNPNVTWLALCDGHYDLIFSIRVKNLGQLKHILIEFLNKYDVYVKERTITTILSAEFLPRDYLLEKKRSFGTKVILGEKEGIDYDTIDLKILALLSKDSTTPVTEIARQLNLSIPTIITRIKKLEKKKIIQKYSIILDNSKLNQLHFKILIGMRNITQYKEKSLSNYLMQLPNVFFIANTLGLWELEVDLEIKTMTDIRKIITDITTKFSDIIKDYSTLHIYTIYKYEFFSEQNLADYILPK